MDTLKTLGGSVFTEYVLIMYSCRKMAKLKKNRFTNSLAFFHEMPLLKITAQPTIFEKFVIFSI